VYDATFRSLLVEDLRNAIGCPTCYVLIISISSGSVLVATEVYYPEATAQQPEISEQELVARLTDTPEVVFSSTFIGAYGMPVTEDAVVIFAPPPPDSPPPPVPPSPPPPPPAGKEIQSSLVLETPDEFGSGTQSSPFRVQSAELLFTLDFFSQLDNAPAGVTGLDISDIEILSSELRPDVHYAVSLDPSDPVSTVSSVAVSLQAVGVWPICGRPFERIKVQLKQGTVFPSSSIHSGVSASDAVHIEWDPGSEYILACAQPSVPSAPPPAAPQSPLQPSPPPPPPPLEEAVLRFAITFGGSLNDTVCGFRPCFSSHSFLGGAFVGHQRSLRFVLSSLSTGEGCCVPNLTLMPGC